MGYIISPSKKCLAVNKLFFSFRRPTLLHILDIFTAWNQANSTKLVIVHFWLHHTAHCAEMMVSMCLHVGRPSVDRVGQGEVAGVTCKVTCTWWLLGMALKGHGWDWVDHLPVANFYLTHPFLDLVSAQNSSWQTAHARVGGVV